MLRNVSQCDMSVELFGVQLPAPVMLAPVGVQGILHAEGELASARAAAALGLPFTLSTTASRSIEETARAADGAGNGVR
jgi:isopentenyl diphosphate isomerase/L-lactate dehydrogenase-like FMN-dependent dehydrogenase